MHVYKLTNQQAQQIEGKYIDDSTIIVPVKDNNGNYYITIELKNSITSNKIEEWGVKDWWNDLPLIPYNPLVFNFN